MSDVLAAPAADVPPRASPIVYVRNADLGKDVNAELDAVAQSTKGIESSLAFLGRTSTDMSVELDGLTQRVGTIADAVNALLDSLKFIDARITALEQPQPAPDVQQPAPVQKPVESTPAPTVPVPPSTDEPGTYATIAQAEAALTSSGYQRDAARHVWVQRESGKTAKVVKSAETGGGGFSIQRA